MNIEKKARVKLWTKSDVLFGLHTFEIIDSIVMKLNSSPHSIQNNTVVLMNLRKKLNVLRALSLERKYQCNYRSLHYNIYHNAGVTYCISRRYYTTTSFVIWTISHLRFCFIIRLVQIFVLFSRNVLLPKQ